MTHDPFSAPPPPGSMPELVAALTEVSERLAATAAIIEGRGASALPSGEWTARTTAPVDAVRG